MVALAAMGLWALSATAQLGAQQQAPRLDPEITFSLDGECRGIDRALRDADEADAAEGLVRWRGLARKAAALQQLDCTEDLVGATSRMVDEAERGDSLAMAALGVMCKRPPPTAQLSLPLEKNMAAALSFTRARVLEQISSVSNAHPSATSRGVCTGSPPLRSSSNRTLRQ